MNFGPPRFARYDDRHARSVTTVTYCLHPRLPRSAPKAAPATLGKPKSIFSTAQGGTCHAQPPRRLLPRSAPRGGACHARKAQVYLRHGPRRHLPRPACTRRQDGRAEGEEYQYRHPTLVLGPSPVPLHFSPTPSPSPPPSLSLSFCWAIPFLLSFSFCFSLAQLCCRS